MVGVGVVAALLLGLLRLPTVAGLLVAGALVGPHGLGLVGNLGLIESLAEVGVVLLLFTVGLEFSLRRLRIIARQVLVGGTLQVLLTVAAVLLVSTAFGLPPGKGVFLGFLFALSSTAIVLRGLSERGELDAPHGRLVVGVLIFQDLCVVPMMLLLPLLAGVDDGAAGKGLALALGKAVLVVAGTLLVSKLALPRLFAWVVGRRSRELFVLAIVAVCMGGAWLTSLVGLSLALGAFLAGLVLADTTYGERAMAEIISLRDVFSSLFFMSMGMLFDGRVLIEHPLLVAVLLGGLVVGKGFVATVAAMAMRFPARVAWLVGVGLGQFGEFGFVLARAGDRMGLLDADDGRALLAAGAISMFVTPLLVRAAPHVSAGERLLRPLERLLGARGIDEVVPEHEQLTGHVVIGGYGAGGRLLGRALTESGFPWVALDLDAERVREARGAGAPVYYGDVTSVEALAHARLAHARVLALSINDPEAARRALAATRVVAPDVAVIVRARALNEAELWKSLGADNVVSERLEGSLELLARVMRRVGVAGNLIAGAIRQARAGTQESHRKPTLPRQRLGEVSELAELKIESVFLRTGDHAVGKGVAALDLRRRTGALVVAIRRGGGLLGHGDAEQPLAEGDVLFLAGDGAAIRKAFDLLERDGASS